MENEDKETRGMDESVGGYEWNRKMEGERARRKEIEESTFGSFGIDSDDFGDMPMTEEARAASQKAKESQIPGSKVESETDSSAALMLGDIKWGQLHESILLAWLTDGDWGGKELESLADRLRTTVPELQSMAEAIPQEMWYQKRLEKLLELEQLKQRGFNWDKLEGAAVNKLVEMMLTKKLSLGEVLSVARVANIATRRGSTAGGEIMEQKLKPGDQTHQNVQVNVYGQPIAGQGLPGQGSIGKITLQLSHRTVTQLGQGKVIEAEKVSLSDSIEMLGPGDLKELNELDGSSDD